MSKPKPQYLLIRLNDTVSSEVMQNLLLDMYDDSVTMMWTSDAIGVIPPLEQEEESNA